MRTTQTNILANFDLQMNVAKTEKTTLSKTSNAAVKTKKLGSLLNTDSEINRRIILSNQALKRLQHLWAGRKCSIPNKIKLYNALVVSIMQYNLSTCGFTRRQQEKLDAAHRKQLRNLCGIFYPRIVSNSNLYQMTRTHQLTINIMKYRWTLYGHILRLPPPTPAQQVMITYFNNPTNLPKNRGKPKTNIVTQLNQDLRMIGMTLQTLDDHLTLHQRAQHRENWRNMIEALLRTYKIQLETRQLEKRTKRRTKRLTMTRTVEINGVPKRIRIFFQAEDAQAMEIEEHKNEAQERPMLRLPRHLFNGP